MLLGNKYEAQDMVCKRGRPSKGEKPIDAKRKLLDAAVGLIEQKGIEAVTVNNVPNESGISNGTFFIISKTSMTL